MSEAKAAGLKSDEELTKRMRDLLGEIADGMSTTLARAERDDEYDQISSDRLRDREMGHITKLAAASAQLLRSFMKLRYP